MNSAQTQEVAAIRSVVDKLLIDIRSRALHPRNEKKEMLHVFRVVQDRLTRLLMANPTFEEKNPCTHCSPAPQERSACTSCDGTGLVVTHRPFGDVLVGFKHALGARAVNSAGEKEIFGILTKHKIATPPMMEAAIGEWCSHDSGSHASLTNRASVLERPIQNPEV